MEAIASRREEQSSPGTPLGKWCLMVCLIIVQVPGCMMSGTRDGKDLLRNLTIAGVKHVSLPVGGSEAFTAFLRMNTPHFSLGSCFLGAFDIPRYYVSLFSESTHFEQLMAPHSLLPPPAEHLTERSDLLPPRKPGSGDRCGEPWPPSVAHGRSPLPTAS